jgi:hypothetical protein
MILLFFHNSTWFCPQVDNLDPDLLTKRIAFSDFFKVRPFSFLGHARSSSFHARRASTPPPAVPSCLAQ